MTKRQSLKEKKENSEDFPTFSTPKSVAKPRDKREMNFEKIKVLRTENEQALKTKYLDELQKLLPRDLGVIQHPKYYPDDRKKERRYKRAVQRAKNYLEFLSYLIELLKPRYRNQILLSDEFDRVLKKYLGVSKETSIELTQQEKDQALVVAIQMLGNSLDVIKKNMPMEFHQSLNNLGLPFANLIDSISIYARSRDKTIPKIRISENFMQR